MNKKYIFPSLIAIGISNICITFALNPVTTGKMVDNFKVRQEKILFESLPFTDTGANSMLENEYKKNGLEALKAKLESVEKVYVEKKADATNERRTLESSLQALAVSIAATEDAIENAKQQILSKQQKIQTLEFASVELKKKINEHRKIILSYMANIYSEGNMVFDSGWKVDLMKAMILTGEETDFYLTDMTYKAIVSELGQKFIDEYKALVREYYVTGIKTSEEKEWLQNLQQTLEKQNATLQAQKQEREKLLEITKWQEELFQQYIVAQQVAQQQVATAWQKANEDYNKSFDNFLNRYNCSTNSSTEECTRLKQFFQNEVQLAKSETKTGTENILNWPVGSRRITTFFHDPAYFVLVGSQHDAIDIGTPQGSDVLSAADWYVYYINPPTPTSYSYLAIKHKNGMVTVYGHLSQILVTPYQYVEQWQIIAKSWWAPGTPWAGPATTWPHLHFEVWKDKNPVDPLRFISIADIDYKSLPAIYQTKFLTDMVEKSGTGVNLSGYKVRFTLKGASEEERQKYLLNTYATEAFKNWETWTDTALAANIDPSFLMCIWLSETTLGNHLKTPYNVGNVGNTDNWSTVTFGSAEEGIAWMAKTFNNKYLGKYNSIDQLSRWGNDSGPIYASSNSEWHDNTIRCLTALKWRFVEDNYNFRVQATK